MSEGKRSLRRILITAGLLLLLLLVIDGVYVGIQLAGDMLGVADDLQTGADELRDGNFSAASAAFEDASESAADGEALLGHPAALVGRILPYVGSETDAVRRLMSASESTADAGAAAVEGAHELGLKGDQDPADALVQDGVVRLPLLEAALPHVTTAASELQDARAQLEGRDPPRLGILQSAFIEARERIFEASDTAANAAHALRLLPELLGGNGTRRYLLAFQSLNEQRGTGGVIGAYGVLEARGGRMSLVHVGPIQELIDRLHGRIEPPPNYSQLDISSGALAEFQQVNLVPHWPTAARGLLAMYEKAAGEALDGAMAMDPVTLSYLMRGAPPLAVPKLGVEVTAANVVDVLTIQGYTKLTEEEQTAMVVGLVGHFWQAFEDGDLPARDLAEGIRQSIDTHHLKLFSLHRDAEEPLDALDATDDFTNEGDDVQLVYGNNISVNKVDVFLHRTIDVEIERADDGSTTVTTRVTLDNRAPTSPVTLLNAPFFKQDPVGLVASDTCVVLPADGRWRSFEIDGKHVDPLVEKEMGRPAACDLVEVRAGDEGTLEATYEVPELASLVLYPQTTINPDRYRVTTPAGDVRRGTLERPVEIDL